MPQPVAKTREQFAATLGSFQALQHRMVDMFAAVETSASRVQAALARIADPESAVDLVYGEFLLRE